MPEFAPHGIMTAMVTPFCADGSLNLSVIPELVEYQLSAGVSGVAVTAGAGEYVTLSPDERAAVAQATSAALHGRVPLIVGILAPDTRSAIMASSAAREAGADALLVLTPYYIAPSPDGLVDHFLLVAEHARLPIIAYNSPGRTGINLDLPVLQRLVDIPDIVAVKECDRDLGRVARKVQVLGSRLAFLNGDDDLCLPFFCIEPRGAIMASTNLVAPWAVALFNAVRDGRLDEARRIFRSRVFAFVELYKGPDHPGPLKQAMEMAGFSVGTGRPPLHPLSEERLDKLGEGLRALDLLNLGKAQDIRRQAGRKA